MLVAVSLRGAGIQNIFCRHGAATHFVSDSGRALDGICRGVGYRLHGFHTSTMDDAALWGKLKRHSFTDKQGRP